MEILSTAETEYAAEEDELLNFSLDTEEQPEDIETILKGAGAGAASSSSYSPGGTTPFRRETRSGSLTEFVEEELEWLSNKDAFPAVETCFFGILSDNPELMVNHQSPVSVLENSSGSSSNRNGSGGTTVASCCRSLKVPSRPRSSSTRKRRTTGFPEWASQQCLWRSQVNKIKSDKESSLLAPPFSGITTGSGGFSMVKRCLHCQAEKTPQWRAGPMGPKTLCNACGVRFKSGRLLPEYRPANSPTFSTALHSNSHRKVVEMRKHKQVEDGGGVMVNEGCGYRRSRIDK